MLEILELLNELHEEDVEWIFSEGVQQNVIANTVIIREGEVPDSIFFVLQGLLGVQISAISSQPLRLLGPGEVVGEMSYLEKEAANANVTAVESSLLLALSKKKLDARVKEDPVFGTHLFRAMAKTISMRLRHSMAAVSLQLKDRETLDRVVEEKWALLFSEINRFKALVQKADEEALQNQGEIPASLFSEVLTRFRAFSEYLNATLGDASGEPELIRHEMSQRIKLEILPYILLTETAERMYSKPRGYAGDYFTIQLIYENKPSGTGRIGPLMDACFQDEPAAKAVRNRRYLLLDEIQRTFNEKEGSVVRVTSMACGPAAEVFDCIASLDDPAKIDATLVDIDMQALAFVSDRIERSRLKRYVKPVFGNLVYLATGRQKLDIPEQDLVYSIGLIDYFNDKFVIALMNYVYDLLAPGGRIILGNFHPRNTTKALMDHVLDWKLIHRTEEDMNRLYAASRFGSPCTNIRFEEEGVNLFAECRKSD